MSDSTTSVAVLGTGIMGAGMATNLARAGLPTTAWNRSPDKARPLAAAGITVAGDEVAAVAGADVVVTMLFDADSVASVMATALPAMADGAVWVQSATVGLDGVDRLAALAAEHGVAFVDAPVMGTRKPAETGNLVVLASGPAELRERVAPVFDAVGSRTVWVGEAAGDAHRLKLVGNSWVASLVVCTAQAIGLARGLGLDPQQWLDSLAGGASDSPYAHLKGAQMIAGEFPPDFALDGAVKDTGLIADALRGAGLDDSLMRAANGLFVAASEAGHGAEDMAAVIHGFRTEGA